MPRVDFAGDTLGDVLLTPTRIYVSAVLAMLERVRPHAMAHITGGGITENLDRALPPDCDARVVTAGWRTPRIFDVIAQEANLPAEEMLRTFNMGVGFAIILDAGDAPDAAVALRGAGETVYEIGEIVEGSGRVVYA